MEHILLFMQTVPVMTATRTAAMCCKSFKSPTISIVADIIAIPVHYVMSELNRGRDDKIITVQLGQNI